MHHDLCLTDSFGGRLYHPEVRHRATDTTILYLGLGEGTLCKYFTRCQSTQEPNDSAL